MNYENIKLCRAVAALALFAGSCAPSPKHDCNADGRFDVIVGNVLYTLSDTQLNSITPENVTGVTRVVGVAPGEKYRSFCQIKGSSPPRVNSINVNIKQNGDRSVSQSIDIFSPSSIVEKLKPHWPPVSSGDVSGFSYGNIDKTKSVDLNMRAVLSLKSGGTRELRFWCSWTDRPLNGHHGGWIALCRPILPMADGNFLRVSTGGMPDDKPEVIGQDIVRALEGAEGLNRKEVTK